MKLRFLLLAVVLLGITHPAHADERPMRADCWVATLDQAAKWDYWQGQAKVDCSKPHQLITYTVAPLATSPKASDDRKAMMKGAFKACGEGFTNNRGGTRLLPYAFGPSPSQWSEGQRWVRCDYAVIAFGSTEKSRKFQTLVGDASEALRSWNEWNINVPATEIDLCYKARTKTGADLPVTKGARWTIVDCTKTHPRWQVSRSYSLNTGAYPYDNQQGQSSLVESCRQNQPKGALRAAAVYPSREAFEKNESYARCVYLMK